MDFGFLLVDDCSQTTDRHLLVVDAAFAVFVDGRPFIFSRLQAGTRLGEVDFELALLLLQVGGGACDGVLCGGGARGGA